MSNLIKHEPGELKNVNFEIKSEIIKQDYSHNHLELISAKKVTFLNCNFSFSRIKDSYFRECRFIHCNFNGVKISDSNFRNSQLDNCNITYSEFKNTHISLDQIIQNLPKEESITIELLQNLKKNYDSIGDRETQKRVVELEIGTMGKVHNQKVKSIFKKDEYFSPRINTPTKKLKAFKDWSLYHLNYFLWGHGEFLHPIFIVLLLTFVYCLLWSFALTQELQWRDRILLIIENFLGIPSTASPNYINLSHLKYVIPALKIYFLGFAISVFSRRHSWR